MSRKTVRIVVSKGSKLKTVLLLLMLLLLSAFIPWLLLPIGIYVAYKAGKWIYRIIKSIKWPKPSPKDQGYTSPVSVIGDIQIYEIEGVGPALVVKNGLEALGLGCLEVKSLGGGKVAELLGAIDATAKSGFESNLIISRRSSGDASLMIMVKARRPLDRSFIEAAKDVIDDVIKGLTAAMGAVKARLPRSELHVLEFDELIRAIRGVVA
ncbi:MAG: hypothetical protein ACXQTI_10475 [Candidatus Nezhaarchaeales archaeon]